MGHGRKPGRKPQHYRTSWGDCIPGLARRPSDGRWRVIGTGFTFTEPDERLAIHRYLTQYAPRPKVSTVAFPVPQPPPAAPAELWPVLTTIDPASGRASQHVTEGALWSWFREQILVQPQYVARMTGIEQIGYLSALPKPVPSPTLREVGELYFERAAISANWKSKCRSFWDEFRECVGVSTLRALEQEHLVGYFDQVTEAAQTPTHARQRFGAIKAIINFPPKRGKWAEDAKRAAALCAVLVPPEKSATDPRPISRDEFQSLYAAANTPMKGVLLLALNCCMYGGEVASLSWSDMDLERSVLSTERNKTKVVRVAVLWPETVALLKLLPRTGPTVFLNSAGTAADYLHVYREFKAVRATAKLPAVQFSQIRDGAYTEAVEAGVELNLCKLLAGQATGISDHYVKRRPRMVAIACDAIYKAYGPFSLPS
jgi:integrase